MNKNAIDNKFYRFIYINTWAFVLIGAGVLMLVPSIIILTTTRLHLALKIYLFSFSIALAVCGFILLSKYKKRMELYNFMIEKNLVEFHPDSFRHLMNHPCGRKLSRVILHDLNREEDWKHLRKLFPFSF